MAPRKQRLPTSGLSETFENANGDSADDGPVTMSLRRPSATAGITEHGWFTPVKTVKNFLFSSRRATEEDPTASRTPSKGASGDVGSKSTSTLVSGLLPTSQSQEFFSPAGTSSYSVADKGILQEMLLTAAEEEDTEAQVLVSIHADEGKRKRTSPHTAENRYSEQVRDTEEGGPAKKQVKRGKGIKVAKTPLTTPRNSKGEIESVVLPIKTTGTVPRKQELAEKTDGNGFTLQKVRSPEKKRRGRPRKTPLEGLPSGTVVQEMLAASAASDVTVKETSAGEDDDAGEVPHLTLPRSSLRSPRRELTDASTSQDKTRTTHMEDPGNQAADAGVLEILMDPSPVKLASPLQIPRPSWSKAKFLSAEPLTSTTNKSHSEDTSESESMHGNDAGPQLASSPVYLEHFVEPKLLQTLVTNLRRVGYTKNSKTNIWYKKHTLEACATKHGKSLHAHLDKLMAGYLAFKSSNSAPDNLHVLVDSVREQCGPIVQELSDGSPGEGEDYNSQNTPILCDLYFVLIPRFMEIVKTGIEAHTTEAPMTDLALQQIKDLLDSLFDISQAAAKQPIEYQPVARPRGSYRIQQPVSHFLPKLGVLRDGFVEEINVRERAAEAIEKERRAAVKREARRAEEATAEEIKRRQVKEIHKQQRAAFQAQLAGPVLPQRYHSGMAKEPTSAAISETQLSSYHRAQYTKADKIRSDVVQEFPFDDNDEGNGDDPFAEDQSAVERVRGLFPSNNNKDTYVPWTYDEKIEFTNIMMAERGNDRYEIAAENLGRSIEEIFVHAQGLQVAFDNCHKEGKLMKVPQDDWTFDVWIEKE